MSPPSPCSPQCRDEPRHRAGGRRQAAVQQPRCCPARRQHRYCPQPALPLPTPPRLCYHLGPRTGVNQKWDANPGRLEVAAASCCPAGRLLPALAVGWPAAVQSHVSLGRRHRAAPLSSARETAVALLHLYRADPPSQRRWHHRHRVRPTAASQTQTRRRQTYCTAGVPRRRGPVVTHSHGLMLVDIPRHTRTRTAGVADGMTPYLPLAPVDGATKALRAGTGRGGACTLVAA